MGTDIHLYVEQRQADGSWKPLPPPERDLNRYPRVGYDGKSVKGGDRPSPFWGPHGCMYEVSCYSCTPREDYWNDTRGRGCDECLGTGRDLRWYHNRNYDVFAILANVRNGYGFAGVDRGDGFRVISMPKGEPADLSDTLARHHSWDHTPSWLSMAEILAFDWSQVTVHRGVIPMRREDETFGYRPDDLEPFVEWREKGPHCPKSFSGSVSGGDIVTVLPVVALRLLDKEYQVDPKKRYYVQVSWTETYAESAEDFLKFVDEFVKPLGDMERIRLVFGFDS